jgi:hypothetical protein
MYRTYASETSVAPWATVGLLACFADGLITTVAEPTGVGTAARAHLHEVKYASLVVLPSPYVPSKVLVTTASLSHRQ